MNVEAVNTRWVDNIGKFLEAADNQVFDTYKDDIADTMKEDEQERDETKGRNKPKMVEGAGWVIEIRGYTDHYQGPQFIKKALIRNLQKFDAFAKNEKKVGEFIVGVQDPVKGKVSQAFIYKVWTVKDPQPNAFQWIGDSPLDKLLGGGSAAGGSPFGGGGRGGFPGAVPPGFGGQPGETTTPTAGPLGPSWSPLVGGVGGNGAGVLGGVGAMSGGLTGPPIGGLPATPPSTAVTGSKDKEQFRYEFVVMLVWREPVLPITLDPPALPATPTPGG